MPTKTNPLGVKGAGEGGTVGALSAVMNAVNDALARIGAPYVQMPATSEKVWRAMQTAKQNCNSADYSAAASPFAAFSPQAFDRLVGRHHVAEGQIERAQRIVVVVVVGRGVAVA